MRGLGAGSAYMTPVGIYAKRPHRLAVPLEADVRLVQEQNQLNAVPVECAANATELDDR